MYQRSAAEYAAIYGTIFVRSMLSGRLHWLFLPPSQKLINLGCCHFAVSGPRAELIHDEIDDVLLNTEHELVLTTWHTGSMLQTAGDFLAVECPDSNETLRLVIPFSDDEQIALKLLSEMIQKIV